MRLVGPCLFFSLVFVWWWCPNFIAVDFFDESNSFILSVYVCKFVTPNTTDHLKWGFLAIVIGLSNRSHKTEYFCMNTASILCPSHDIVATPHLHSIGNSIWLSVGFLTTYVSWEMTKQPTDIIAFMYRMAAFLLDTTTTITTANIKVAHLSNHKTFLKEFSVTIFDLKYFFLIKMNDKRKKNVLA